MATDDAWLTVLVTRLPDLIAGGWLPWGFGPPDAPSCLAFVRRGDLATDVLVLRPRDAIWAYRAPMTAGPDALRTDLVCWAFNGTLDSVLAAAENARQEHGALYPPPPGCRPPSTAPWAYPVPVLAPDRLSPAAQADETACRATGVISDGASDDVRPLRARDHVLLRTRR